MVEALEGIGNTPAHTNHAMEIASEIEVHETITNHLIVTIDNKYTRKDPKTSENRQKNKKRCELTSC